MEKSLGILLNFWGVFQFTHTLPLPSSHKQRWTHVSRLFLPQSQLCIGQGRENYKKILKSMHCLAGAKPSCVHQDTLSCMKKLFEISRKIRYFMKTYCTAFLGLLPASSSHNTPAGLPKPRVLRCRDASKQSVANAQFDSFSLV